MSDDANIERGHGKTVRVIVVSHCGLDAALGARVASVVGSLLARTVSLVAAVPDTNISEIFCADFPVIEQETNIVERGRPSLERYAAREERKQANRATRLAMAVMRKRSLR